MFIHYHPDAPLPVKIPLLKVELEFLFALHGRTNLDVQLTKIEDAFCKEYANPGCLQEDDLYVFRRLGLVDSVSKTFIRDHMRYLNGRPGEDYISASDRNAVHSEHHVPIRRVKAWILQSLLLPAAEGERPVLSNLRELLIPQPICSAPRTDFPRQLDNARRLGRRVGFNSLADALNLTPAVSDHEPTARMLFSTFLDIATWVAEVWSYCPDTAGIERPAMMPRLHCFLAAREAMVKEFREEIEEGPVMHSTHARSNLKHLNVRGIWDWFWSEARELTMNVPPTPVAELKRALDDRIKEFVHMLTTDVAVDFRLFFDMCVKIVRRPSVGFLDHVDFNDLEPYQSNAQDLKVVAHFYPETHRRLQSSTYSTIFLPEEAGRDLEQYVRHESPEDGEICFICLESYGRDTDLGDMRCVSLNACGNRHRFHYHCLHAWVIERQENLIGPQENHRMCPMCRVPMLG